MDWQHGARKPGSLGVKRWIPWSDEEKGGGEECGRRDLLRHFQSLTLSVCVSVLKLPHAGGARLAGQALRPA